MNFKSRFIKNSKRVLSLDQDIRYSSVPGPGGQKVKQIQIVVCPGGGGGGRLQIDSYISVNCHPVIKTQEPRS